MMNALDSTSTRPYLIRALYEWCTDNGFTPYVAVLADDVVAHGRHLRPGNKLQRLHPPLNGFKGAVS